MIVCVTQNARIAYFQYKIIVFEVNKIIIGLAIISHPAEHTVPIQPMLFLCCDNNIVTNAFLNNVKYKQVMLF